MWCSCFWGVPFVHTKELWEKTCLLKSRRLCIGLWLSHFSFCLLFPVVFWGNLFFLRELRVLTEQSPLIYIHTYNTIHDPVRITARLEDSPICIIKKHVPKLNIWNKQYTMPMRNTETRTDFYSILNTAQGQQHGMM